MEPLAKKIRSAPFLARCGVWSLCGWCACSGTAHGQNEYNPDWARNFRIGMLAGFNIKANFRLTSAAFGVSGKPGAFDDGYVTPDPNNTADDYTSNWGYNDSSQFDGNHTLTMHKTTSFTPTSGGKGSDDDSPYLGFDLEYGGYLWRWDYIRLGWNFGLGILPINVTDSRPMTADVQRSAFAFDTGPHVLFPPAGYHGNSGGDGQNIHSTPTAAGSDTINDVQVTGSRTLDVILYTFRLGPTVFWDVNPYIGLAFGAGPAMGLVSGEYRFDETIGAAKNKGSFGATDVVFGGYVNATITYHAVENGDFYLSAQYMPMGTSTFSDHGRQAKLDLSGATFISAGINWPF